MRYVEKRMLKMAQPGIRKGERSKRRFMDGDEGGHALGWTDTGLCRGHGGMVTDDPNGDS